MKVAAIRDKLSDYIRRADDEKIKAMYVLLKDNINEDVSWWQNNDLLKEFEADYKNWKSGKTKGYTLDEVESKIDQLRLKRSEK